MRVHVSITYTADRLQYDPNKFGVSVTRTDQWTAPDMDTAMLDMDQAYRNLPRQSITHVELSYFEEDR